MKQSSYKGKSPLLDFVIDAACAGDAEAVERILQYYDGYINKLCTRTLYDGNGQPHICIDQYMKRRLQIKLISDRCIEPGQPVPLWYMAAPAQSHNGAVLG